MKITIQNLSKAFGGRDIFSDFSLDIDSGVRLCVCGPNGCGKSTLIRMLADADAPDSGRIIMPRGCRVGYVQQDLDEAVLDTPLLEWVVDVLPDWHDFWSAWEAAAASKDEAAIARLGARQAELEALYGYNPEHKAQAVLSGLGFDEGKWHLPIKQLSGGWRERAKLARVLVAGADVLLLDEPTNHLDMSSIDWLCNMLRSHEGTVVVISHNRYFLNEVCTHIADLDYQEIRLFTGNYDAFMTANAIALENIRRENQKKENRISELKEFINRFGANASKARQATSRQKELEKIQLEEIKPSSRVSPFIRFRSEVRLGERVIEGTDLAKVYDRPLFEHLNLTIGNEEKVAIIGTNGAGKTTLLKTLLKQIEPCCGDVVHGETVKLSYFPQDAAEVLNMEERAIDWLARFAPERGLTEMELRSYLGKMLFSGDEVYKPVQVLSGGEKARLILAKMMLEAGNVLALDEPTNHLDLESIEALNYALTLYPNTVIFVSHDREFVGSLATRIIEISDGVVTDYPGTLAEYEEFKRRRARKK